MLKPCTGQDSGGERAPGEPPLDLPLTYLGIFLSMPTMMVMEKYRFDISSCGSSFCRNGNQTVSNQARMHSSRMHTGHSLPYRGSVSRGELYKTGNDITQRPPLPLWAEWLIDRCKNITFPQIRLREVKSQRFCHQINICNSVSSQIGVLIRTTDVFTLRCVRNVLFTQSV